MKSAGRISVLLAAILSSFILPPSSLDDMAVVINEFEVVPSEASPKRDGSSPGQSGTASPPEPEPEAIERMLEHERERCERVWAH